MRPKVTHIRGGIPGHLLLNNISFDGLSYATLCRDFKLGVIFSVVLMNVNDKNHLSIGLHNELLL